MWQLHSSFPQSLTLATGDFLLCSSRQSPLSYFLMVSSLYPCSEFSASSETTFSSYLLISPVMVSTSSFFINSNSFSGFRLHAIHSSQSETSFLVSTWASIFTHNTTSLPSALAYNIIHLCIHSSLLPPLLKVACVKSLHKKGDPTNCSNYHHISILIAISKILGKS